MTTINLPDNGEPQITLFAKGNPETGELLDCPFCHRVILTLRAKDIPFNLEFIDFDHKPQWLIDTCHGKVPVIKVPADGNLLLPDSDAIVEYLEKKFPEKPLAPSAPSSLIANVWPAFRGLILSSEKDTPTKTEELLAQLKPIDEYLSTEDRGPLFGGLSLDASDCAFAPKLYHTLVACGHFKGFRLPASMAALWRYMGYVQLLSVWQRDDYGSGRIIAGWRHHGAVETAGVVAAP